MQSQLLDRVAPTIPAAGGAGRPAPEIGRWLVGPTFDLLFVANAAWPLLALAQFGEGLAARPALQFWQLYYVTTPHRWITLSIVFLDPGRLRQRARVFLLAAAAVVGFCLAVRLTTGALTCLLAIDYVWNGWHFAAQHHGVYRTYGRLAGRPVGATSEKWAMRLFLLYVILRVATATWPDDNWRRWMGWCDWAAILVPAWLLSREALRPGPAAPGRIAYLVSVMALYLALLGAVHEGRHALVLCLATASALFHATEYLALVSWSVRRRHATSAGEMGLLGTMIPRWGLALAAFVLILGAGGWLMDRWAVEAWLSANVVAAFLHYTYDGLIWRQRRAVAPEMPT